MSATSPNNVTTSRATQFNLTEKERLSYLRYLDSKKWPYIFPVIIYLVILMVIGIIGNSIVIAVYYKKFKPSVPRLFILTLATFDLLICSLSIPGVIVELRYHYTFFFPMLCRIFRVIRTYFVTVSMFTLIILAVDRDKKVCRLFKPQYTIRSVWISLIAYNILAMCIATLACVVGGIHAVETDRKDVTGSNCSYDDDFIGKPIITFHGGLSFVVFIVCIAILVVLYSLIGRHVWKHRKFHFTQDQSAPSPFTSSQNVTMSTQIQSLSIVSNKKYKVAEAEESSCFSGGKESISVISYSVMGNTTSSVPLTQRNTSGLGDKSENKSFRQSKHKPAYNQSVKHNQQSESGVHTRSTNKTTFTLFIITVVFTVSFLPYLVLFTLMESNWTLVNSLDGYRFTVFNIFFYSYHVNNAVNCYIYSFCNPKFRDGCKQLLCAHKMQRL